MSVASSNKVKVNCQSAFNGPSSGIRIIFWGSQEQFVLYLLTNALLLNGLIQAHVDEEKGLLIVSKNRMEESAPSSGKNLVLLRRLCSPGLKKQSSCSIFFFILFFYFFTSLIWAEYCRLKLLEKKNVTDLQKTAEQPSFPTAAPGSHLPLCCVSCPQMF